MSDVTRIDMAPEAIARRMRILDELWEFWQSLRGARILGPVEELRRETGVFPRVPPSPGSVEAG